METSKVLVSYYDPFKVFPSIAKELRDRLPLRKLNWNSPSRPFRSIPSLHVEFVPEQASDRETDATNGRNTSEEASEASSSRARRHQIPGLRRSPYLKIYFFVCDNVEEYRNTVRKEIREWLRVNTPKTQSSTTLNKQDNHDAFEWLVVQVLSDPEDGPAINAGVKPDGDSGKRTSSSRWSSRGPTTTVIEKVRADLNGTSKTAIDRVAQVAPRRQGEDRGSNAKEALENKSGWSDLLLKMKSLILSSFDSRVAQYEEDIKEKELQRRMPGWNFNTYFVLKEGLARGFENVGLLEDALTGYKELAMELSMITDSQDDVERSASPFNNFTEEVLGEITAAIQHDNSSGQTHSEDADFGSQILDTGRKDYRQLILANNISVFDFQCYVFARQTSLLLRLANAGYDEGVATTVQDNDGAISTASLTKPSDHEPENLLVLVETCQLATRFVASAATHLRKDVEASFKHLSGSHLVLEGPNGVFDNLVISWSISVVQVILKVTQSVTLITQIRPILSQLQSSQMLIRDRAQSIAREDQGLPDRTSSLPGSPSKSKTSSEPFPAVAALDALRLLPPGTPHPGARELAAERGNLVMLLRRLTAKTVASIRGWSGGIAVVISEARSNTSGLEEIDLNAEPSKENEGEKSGSASPPIASTSGCRNRSLTKALQSVVQFLDHFEEMTASALAHNVVGNRTNAAEALIADIAVNRFIQQDYNSAASYFDQLAGFYKRTEWQMLEKAMLVMHARCLRHLGKTNDYVKIAMRVIAFQQHGLGLLEDSLWSIADLVSTSASLKDPVEVPLRDHFKDIFLDPYIRHNEGNDGFRMCMGFRNLLPQALESATINVKVKSTTNEHASPLELYSDDEISLRPGVCKVIVGTNVMCPGWYSLSALYVRIGQIAFIEDDPSLLTGAFVSDSKHSGSTAKEGQKVSRFLVWARQENLRPSMDHFHTVDLRKPRSLQITLWTGWNHVEKGRLYVRAASAGLRLDTADSEGLNEDEGDSALLTQGDWKIHPRRNQPGVIDFREISAESTKAVRVPYSLEHDLNEVTVKVEIVYHTRDGEFTHSSDCTCSIALPLSVNVQDIFKSEALFSRFTVGLIGPNPMRLHYCRVESNDYYHAISTKPFKQCVDIFSRQPYSLITKIQHKKTNAVRPSTVGKSFQKLLHLQIEYHSISREVHVVLENDVRHFLQARSMTRFFPLLKGSLGAIVEARKPFGVDMETICLVGEFAKGAYGDYNWDDVLSALQPDDAKQLQKVLREWFEASSALSLMPRGPKGLGRQRLTVPFEIPQTEALYTAKFIPYDGRVQDMSSDSPIAVDQPLAVQLLIARARPWDAEKTAEKQPEPPEFFYEILASPDTWLVGGQRRAKFRMREGDSQVFQVLLLPRATGRLLYPSVEIAPASRLAVDAAGESGDEDATSYEVDFLNQGESVYVVPDLASTTVSLDPSSGSWLVESRRRNT